jgi:hypothetical protein
MVSSQERISSVDTWRNGPKRKRGRCSAFLWCLSWSNWSWIERKAIGNAFIEFWCRIAPDRRCNLADKEQLSDVESVSVKGPSATINHITMWVAYQTIWN